MTYTTTVPFRDEDTDLLRFLKKRTGTPMKKSISGVAIRDLLYAYMTTVNTVGSDNK